MKRQRLNATPDKPTLEKAIAAGEIIGDIETYFAMQKRIPWETFQTPVGLLYWGKTKAGKARLFLEGNDDIPAITLRIDLRIAIADALKGVLQ